MRAFAFSLTSPMTLASCLPSSVSLFLLHKMGKSNLPHGEKSELSELERRVVHSLPLTAASYWNLNGSRESTLKSAVEI